jgi:AcrR family transcriptional regulator
MRSRRAQILAATRELFATEEFERVTIKNIANTSNLSVPTIYNLIGTRQEVLIDAMNDYTIALGKIAGDENFYPHFVVGLADLYGQLAEAYPNFIKSTTVRYFSKDEELFHPWHDCGVRMIATSLRQSRGAGMTRAGIDIETLARRCSGIISTTVYEWAMGCIDTADLRIELISAATDPLMRAFKPAAAAALDEWIAGFAF